jgi:hypothetical protein
MFEHRREAVGCPDAFSPCVASGGDQRNGVAGLKNNRRRIARLSAHHVLYRTWDQAGRHLFGSEQITDWTIGPIG